MSSSRGRVGLFVTCLVDLFRPSIGLAAAILIERAGYTVEAPYAQTCCGQPAFNSGDRKNARAIARDVIETFSTFDHVVAPSGSCAGMIAKHFPELFSEGTLEYQQACALASKTHELVSFLVDVAGVETVESAFARRATYHDSCSGLRELGVKDQPRRLLRSVTGLELVEMKDADVCCGFGGTFCVKYPDISNDMLEKKTANINESGAEVLLAGDLGCLMNMAGKLKRHGSRVEVRHVAEVLASDTARPGIGDADRKG